MIGDLSKIARKKYECVEKLKFRGVRLCRKVECYTATKSKGTSCMSPLSWHLSNGDDVISRQTTIKIFGKFLARVGWNILVFKA